MLGLRKMFDIINGASEQNAIMAEMVMQQAAKLSFMNQ